MKNKLQQLIINKIEKDYKDDIALLVKYNCQSDDQNLNLYFIPKNEKALNLSTQWILDGIGYDLFPIPWDRLLKVAAMDSPQAYLFNEAEILYVGDQDAETRFYQLKDGLNQILTGNYNEILINKSYEYLNETYIYLFNMENVCQDLLDVRMEASKLLKQVANILAFVNQSYYKGGNGSPVSIIAESLSLSVQPQDYSNLVHQILETNQVSTLIQAAKSLLLNTRSLLNEKRAKMAEKESYDLMFTGYYEELVKYLRPLHNAIKEDNTYKQFEIASYIHEEVAQFLTKAENGIWYDDRSVYSEYSQVYMDLFNHDLLELIANKDHTGLGLALEKFKKDFTAFLSDKQVTLMSYESFEDFKRDFE